MLRQQLSEWQVIGQVLSRHMEGREEEGGPCGELSYKSVCDLSKHAEGKLMYSNAHKFYQNKRKISCPKSFFLFLFSNLIMQKTYYQKSAIILGISSL